MLKETEVSYDLRGRRTCEVQQAADMCDDVEVEWASVKESEVECRQTSEKRRWAGAGSEW